MPKHIASGLLMYHIKNNEPEFFLVHPGGPFFKNKTEGVWSIPKGLPVTGEELLETAQREFTEETGLIAQPPFHTLGTILQKGGKEVYAWLCEGDWDPASGIKCNTFTLEWPPKSGKFQEFPEVDKAAWMPFDVAAKHIIPQQIPLLERANEFLKS